jgi:hypothetical protein
MHYALCIPLTVRFSFEIHKRITKKMMGGKKGKRGKGENKGLDSFLFYNNVRANKFIYFIYTPLLQIT